MYSSNRFLKTFLVLVFCAVTAFCHARESLPSTDKVSEIMARVGPQISMELMEKGLELGSHIFIRVFKLSGELEVWVEDNGRYRLFKTYPICSYSGYLGPKLKEGDWQSPEGFYRFTPDLMHPRSSYHLAFNIGYPNDYDKLLNRSGNSIMVHGSCSSKGCFAMKDFRIEEIYTLAHAAFMNGQPSIDIHIFPFHLTGDNLDKYRFSPWTRFWKNLGEGYDAFEKNHQVPLINVEKGNYVVLPQPVKLALSKGYAGPRK